MSADISSDAQPLLAFFKALADENRLKIVGVLATRPCGVPELAAALVMPQPAVRRHLERLRELGLTRVETQGAAQIHCLDLDALRAMRRELLERPQPADEPDAPTDAGERAVLANFLDGERLKEMPVARRKRLVVLEWLARRFEPGRRYSEREVNAILERHYPDFAWLRRELVDNRLLQRDHGVYWRDAQPD